MKQMLRTILVSLKEIETSMGNLDSNQTSLESQLNANQQTLDTLVRWRCERLEKQYGSLSTYRYRASSSNDIYDQTFKFFTVSAPNNALACYYIDMTS